MVTKRNRIQRRTVSFGDNHEHFYDSKPLSESERRASFYSMQQFEAMRCHAYGLAKTAALLGEHEERVLHGNTLRGLEKMIPNKTASTKRRRNIVRSIVELRQMETSKIDISDEKTEKIKETLKKYVQKHVATAKKAAQQRALGDEEEARKVYYEGSLMPLQDEWMKEASPRVSSGYSIAA